MSKHTPGPWAIKDDQEPHVIYSLSKVPYPWVVVSTKPKNDEAEWWANAHLIEAKKAIAKAKGEVE